MYTCMHNTIIVQSPKPRKFMPKKEQVRKREREKESARARKREKTERKRARTRDRKRERKRGRKRGRGVGAGGREWTDMVRAACDGAQRDVVLLEKRDDLGGRNVVGKAFRCAEEWERVRQKRLVYMKRDLQKRLTKETYKRDLQKRVTKETYKRDLQKRLVIWKEALRYERGYVKRDWCIWK